MRDPQIANRVLAVDDEDDILQLLSMTLARMQLACDTASTLKEAKNKLDPQRHCLCLADMRLPDGDGIELVEYIQQQYPQLPVAIITAYGNVEGAVNTLKAGAFDYVSKPINLQLLKRLVKTALTLNQQLQEAATPPFIGESVPMQTLRQLIAKVARSHAPVFIQGESGTGKELVARLIHTSSPRAAAAFIPVNCAAIPHELMESEFFGYVKGSFTGAQHDKPGLFHAADGGTLFLDEVGDLPMAMQVKLLRAIQERAIRPLGSQVENPVDVRIISASHKNLLALVKQQKFRQDLFYRVNVIDLHVPPLRDRLDDLPALSEFLVHKISERQHRPKVEISPAALKRLSEHHFPGNVRELENILERAITLAEGSIIQAENLQFQDLLEPEWQQSDLANLLPHHEKFVIQQALDEHKWNRTKAAKTLGMSLRALRYRVKKYGIDR